MYRTVKLRKPWKLEILLILNFLDPALYPFGVFPAWKTIIWTFPSNEMQFSMPQKDPKYRNIASLSLPLTIRLSWAFRILI